MPTSHSRGWPSRSRLPTRRSHRRSSGRGRWTSSTTSSRRPTFGWTKRRWTRSTPSFRPGLSSTLGIGASTRGGSRRPHDVGCERSGRRRDSVGTHQVRGGVMETRRLGRLGHMSSVLIYGGAALIEVPDEVADRSIELALEAGINHFDTAADYGDSELHLGRWMPSLRDRIFLATKTGERSAGGAYDSIRRSLERLQADRVDLLQLHAVGNMAELDDATGPGRALDGAVKARDEGLIGAIGITGHGMAAPATHLEALRRHPFETVLTPWNWRLARFPEYRRDFDALADEIRAQDAGLMLIKTLARNLWREGPHDRTTWYEPLEDQRAIDAAVAFALSRPEVTGIATAGDVGLVPKMVEAESRRGSKTVREVDAVLSEVSEYEPPFIRSEGREVPEWLEHLIPS